MISCEPPLLGLFAQAFHNATSWSSFSLCTLYCETSLGHPSRSRHTWATWSRSVPLDIHTCTDVDFASTHRWLHWQWFLVTACCNGIPSRCVPGVGFHGAPTTVQHAALSRCVSRSLTFSKMFSHLLLSMACSRILSKLCHTFLQYVTISGSPTL